ncbi:MAG: sulfotransferase [Gammaproteobacteria bacterium]|nr:sulfotransferase [Gammaproteobacteria bacterium]
MRKNVVVVGMPRSGTSLTASIFANQGYFLAEDSESELREGDSDNPDGYFEARSLVEANARILDRAGYAHHNTWLYEAIGEDEANAIGKLEHLQEDRDLLKTYDESAPWVWKDPRLCYTLAYWWPLFDHSTTRVLLARRSPDQIWNSFVRLGWREDSTANKDDVYGRISNHLSAAKSTIELLEIPFIEIDYSEYASQPKAVSARINACMSTDTTPADLGYRSRFNHSGKFGSVERIARKLVSAIPQNLRKALKRAIPGKNLE